MKSHLPIWLISLGLGILLLSGLGLSEYWRELTVAWAVVFGIWQISHLRFIASRSAISKMSNAWTSHLLRLSVRRVLLTLVASVTLYYAVGAGWGLTYWLGLIIYYQLGIALTIREAMRALST